MPRRSLSRVPKPPVPGLFKETWATWRSHRGTYLAAALAYYTLLSLAPLLAILASIGGALLGEETAQRALIEQARSLLGTSGAEPIVQFLLDVRPPRTTPLGTWISFGVLLWGAVLVFTHLQRSLNIIWGIEHRRPALVQFVFVRIVSIALIVALAALLIASHFVTSMLTAVGRWAPQVLPGPSLLLHALDFGATFLPLFVLFALIYKILPDTHVPWPDVWIGAGWTALLLSAGKTVLSLYLSRIAIVSIYGAAVSLIVVLIGVFSYMQILLFGAVLTRVRAARRAAVRLARPARARQPLLARFRRAAPQRIVEIRPVEDGGAGPDAVNSGRTPSSAP